MFNNSKARCLNEGPSISEKSAWKTVSRCASFGVGVALSLGLAQSASAITFRTEWTGQILGYSAAGNFSYDEGQTYADGIVRRDDLTDFDISFFDPAGNLLRTYEDNHLTFDEFNFAFDTNTKQVLTDGLFDGPEGINVGEKTAVGDGFTGLNLWSKS